jgi:hypothetical protein
VHATIFFEVTNPLKDWNFLLGLRMKDIPTGLWEIVPLSFMVDRLLNIKNTISGAVNFLDPTVTFLAASTRIKKTTTSNITFTGCTYLEDLYTYKLENPDTVKHEVFEYNRGLWEPTFSDVVPPFTLGGLVEDIAKTADLIAIIVGRFL